MLGRGSMHLRLCLLAICVILAAPDVYAQGNATIVGIVSDTSGGVAPGAEVTLTNEGTGFRAVTTTDAGGRYNFQRLPVGNYRLVSAGYVGSKGSRLWLNREINPAIYIPGNGPDGKPFSGN